MQTTANMILLARQDSDVSLAMTEQAQQAGFLVRQASSPAQLAQMVLLHPPDGVLIDPSGHETEILALIEGLTAKFPHVPVVLVAAAPSADNVLEALRRGVWDYLDSSREDSATLAGRLLRVVHRSGQATEKRHALDAYEQRIREQWTRLTSKNSQLVREIKDVKVQERLLLHAKREWERTVDALPDLIFIVDRDHRITRINKAMRDRLDMAYDEVLGRPCFYCFHGCHRVMEQCPHELLMNDCKQRTVEIEEERLGGFFELTVVPYYDAEGELAGSVHIARDVSAQKQAQKDQEKLQARLLHSAKLESVGQLAAGIAHEINTPTQFITANIDFLDEAFTKAEELCTALLDVLTAVKQGKVAPEQFEAIESLLDELDWAYLQEEIPLAISQSKEGLQRVTSIVQAIKEFSHPGSKQKVSADLNKIIKTTITVARNEWKYVATVDTHLDPILETIPCHADEIGQVFLNILINAAHAIESKQGEYPENRLGRITITSAQCEHYAEIRIADNGPGIPPPIQHKVFDPFFTTKQVGKGTGQGLAIAHDVVTTKHGGTLSFETSPETGTTFIIRLPRGASEPALHADVPGSFA